MQSLKGQEHVFDDIRQIFPGIIGSLSSGVIVLGQDSCIDLINSAALKVLSINSDDPDEFTDVNISDLCIHLKGVADKYEQIVLKNKRKGFQDQFHIPPGKYVKVIVEKKLDWTLFLLDDVTSTAGLIHEATHDYLTQLFNRRYFETRLEDALIEPERGKDIDSVAFIDLNGFKVINDLAGYMCGDEVLKKVANSILSYTESVDCAARIGGDEFAILFKGKGAAEVKSILGNIQKKVNEIQVAHAKKTMRIDFSAGITEINSDFFENTDQALATAILACGLSKNSGSQHISILSGKEVDNNIVVRDSSVISLLTSAIADERLSLFGQKIDRRLSNDGSVNFEVLLRLVDEHGEYISPSLFVPIAERSRMMVDIDRWVVSNAFGLLEDGLTFFINLSGHSLCDAGVCNHILREAKRHKIRAGSIVFEITETSTITDLDLAREHMLILKAAGFEFALDDFGTGFSSLLYLKHLPISIVKIDGQFIKEMHYDDLSLSMVNMISGMASDLGLKTVAEHVHCKEIHDLLLTSDIDFLQGFYIHRPESLQDLVALHS